MRQHLRRALLAVPLLAMLAATGCSPRGTMKVSDGGCTPGQSISCTCTDGSTGSQTCQSDGTYGTCKCSSDASSAETRDGKPGTDDTGRRADSGFPWDGFDASSDAAGDDRPPHALKSVRGTSKFEQTIQPPTCDGSKSQVAIIDEDSDWSAINDSSVRVFCVRPGDYRNAGPQDSVNRVELQTSGSKNNRRYLLYDGPSTKHPVNQKPDRRALVSGLDLEADYWTIRGLWVDPRDSKGGLDDPVKVGGDAEHNVFDRMLVSPPKGTFVDTYLFQVFGDHTTLQNSVLRNTLGNAGEDRYCVSLSGQTKHLRLVSNELYDCTDGIQLTGFNTRPVYTGTVIAHNDMYITPRYFSDGDGNRGPNNSGDWTCAENAVDIKAGSAEASKPVRVIGNRMWNFSDADTDCASSGTGPRANAITIHNVGNEQGWTTRNIEVRRNLIFEVESGVGVTWSKNVVVENNLLYSYGYKGASSGFEAKPGRGVLTYKAEPTVVRQNTFVDGKTWGKLLDDDELRDNVFVDAGGIDGSYHSVKTSGNAYYGNSTPWEDQPAIEKSNASDAAMEKFCFTIRGYTNPTRKCIPNAVRTPQSPHGSNVGFTPPTE